MNIIEMAKQLGHAIQEDDRYVAYHVALQKSEEDKELQDLIGQFNLKKMKLNTEVSKPERDAQKVEELEKEVRGLYGSIMNNNSMMMFQESKNELDAALQYINRIITASANGQDPDSVEEQDESCGGSCSSCSGCH